MRLFGWLNWQSLVFWWFPDHLNRNAEELRFLQLIQAAMSYQVPVTALIETATPGLSRSWKSMYNQLVLELNAGRPLHEILQPTSTVIPLANPREEFTDPADLVCDETRAWLTVGHEAGILAELIEYRIEELEIQQTRMDGFTRPGTVGLSLLFFLSLNIVLFLNRFILPSFVEISRDFNVSMSKSNDLIIRAFDHAYQIFGPVLSITMIPLLLILVGLGSQTGQHPVQKWLFPFRGRSKFLVALGLAVETKQDVLQVVESTGLFHPSRPLRSKAQRFKAKLEYGEEFADSLHQCGLINASQAEWIDSAEKTGQLGSVLILLGKRYAEQELMFWSTINRFVEIVLMLLLAMVVVLLGILVFSILTTMLIEVGGRDR